MVPTSGTRQLSRHQTPPLGSGATLENEFLSIGKYHNKLRQAPLFHFQWGTKKNLFAHHLAATPRADLGRHFQAWAHHSSIGFPGNLSMFEGEKCVDKFTWVSKIYSMSYITKIYSSFGQNSPPPDRALQLQPQAVLGVAPGERWRCKALGWAMWNIITYGL